MAVDEWSYVLADEDFLPVAEITNASAVSISYGLKRATTASLTVRLDNAQAEFLTYLGEFYRGFLKIYRNAELMFYGLLHSSQKTVDGLDANVSVNAVGPGWNFANRFPNRSNNAVSYTGTRGNIMIQLLDVLNAQFSSTFPSPTTPEHYRQRGETGIGYSGTPSAGGTITYSVAPWRPMNEIVAELANSADGFEWIIRPHENYVSGAVTDQKMGYIAVGAPLGSQKDEATFEFGDGRVNLKSFNQVVSREHQGSLFTHLAPTPVTYGYLDNPPFYNIDAAGVVEWVVQAELTDTTLRTELVTEHHAVRKDPRTIIVWTPEPDYGDGRLPKYGQDYEVGDFVRARGLYLDESQFSGNFRVWAAKVNVLDSGLTSTEVTVEPED